MGTPYTSQDRTLGFNWLIRCLEPASKPNSQNQWICGVIYVIPREMSRGKAQKYILYSKSFRYFVAKDCKALGITSQSDNMRLQRRRISYIMHVHSLPLAGVIVAHHGQPQM